MGRAGLCMHVLRRNYQECGSIDPRIQDVLLARSIWFVFSAGLTVLYALLSQPEVNYFLVGEDATGHIILKH